MKNLHGGLGNAFLICCLGVLTVSAGVALREPVRIAAFDDRQVSYQRWHSASRTLPGMPFELSTVLNHFEYSEQGTVAPPDVHVDTWYPTTASSGKLFTPFTDGTIGNLTVSSNGAAHKTNGSITTAGYARVATSQDEDGQWKVSLESYNAFQSSALPYQGRYPCGSLFYKGVWYYGTYALAAVSGDAQFPCGNWCVQGPFVGFRSSTDGGATWDEPRMEMARDFESYTRTANLFGEEGPLCPDGIDPKSLDCRGQWQGKVKFGAPHFVDLGLELEHSPGGSGVAYMVGHGADQEYQPHSWMQGSQVYMSRTTAEVSAEVMASGDHWEFFAGHDAEGDAIWKASVDDARPLFTWENRTGVVTMTFEPTLKRYIMTVSTPSEASGHGSMVGDFDTYFLESQSITGPFKMVEYLHSFGPQAYFVNVPSSFLSRDAASAGAVQGMLSYSANFATSQKPDPSVSGYEWVLLPFRLAGGSH